MKLVVQAADVDSVALKTVARLVGASAIEQITPQEYRAPAADFSALFRWLADKAKDKK